MFLVIGITGKVGGATAKHLLAHGKGLRGDTLLNPLLSEDPLEV
jgi:nucleoside-diphosphate-sugar epimerase